MKHLDLKLNRFILFVAWAGFVFSCDVPPETGPGEPGRPGESGIAANEIQEFSETPSGQKEAERLGQSFPASDFALSGFYLPPGTDLVVRLEQLNQGSGTPVLLIGSYSSAMYTVC